LSFFFFFFKPLILLYHTNLQKTSMRKPKQKDDDALMVIFDNLNEQIGKEMQRHRTKISKMVKKAQKKAMNATKQLDNKKGLEWVKKHFGF